MKILYDYEIFYQQKYGGISNYYFNLCKEMIKLNNDLIVSCFLYKSKYISNLPKKYFNGLDVNYIPHTFNKFIESINHHYSKNIKKNFSPDIIHQTYYSNRIEPGKRVCTVYDLINEKFPEYFKNAEKISELKKKTLDNSDHVICISENTKKDLIDIFKVPDKKISITYLASPYTNQINTNSNKKFKNHLLYVGSRKAYKNFNGLLKAISLSKFLKNNYKIIAFGGEKYNKDDYEIIKKYKLDKSQVLFVNDKDYNLDFLYSNVDALIYPSIYEGFGIPLLEAMNFGCPVISSFKGSLREVGGNGINYFDPKNPENISEIIEKVICSEDMIKRSVLYGYERTKLFSWSECAKKNFRNI